MSQPKRLDYNALLQEAELNELDVERNEDEVAAINSNDITKDCINIWHYVHNRVSSITLLSKSAIIS